MGKPCDLSDFESSVIAEARHADSSISEVAAHVGFACATFSRSLEFAETQTNKQTDRKTSS